MFFSNWDFGSLYRKIINDTNLTEQLYKELKSNLLEGMVKDRVRTDLFKEYFFEKADFKEFQERPLETELPAYSGTQPFEKYVEKAHNFFTTNVKDIGKLRSIFRNPNKKIKAKITINTPSSIKSIIMGQATGIKRWDIKKYMLKNKGLNHRIVPLYQRTGNPEFVGMSMNSKGWYYPAKQGVIPQTDIIYQDKQVLIVKTTLSKLEQALEKMKRFGHVIIKY